MQNIEHTSRIHEADKLAFLGKEEIYHIYETSLPSYLKHHTTDPQLQTTEKYIVASPAHVTRFTSILQNKRETFP
jgi:hypothetical protein